MRDDARLAGHPVIAFLVVALAGFVLLAAVSVLVGWLLKTYVLPEHGIGHADEHVNVWLAQHRDGTRNDISFWLSGIGDVLAIPALVALTAIAAMVMRRWRVAGFIVAAIAVEAATYRVATLIIHRAAAERAAARPAAGRRQLLLRPYGCLASPSTAASRC